MTVTYPQPSSSELAIFRGDDYYLADGRQLVFTSSTFPTLTGATVLLKIDGETSITGTVTSATSVYFQLTNTYTAALANDNYKYEVQATLTSGRVATLATGNIAVSGQL